MDYNHLVLKRGVDSTHSPPHTHTRYPLSYAPATVAVPNHSQVTSNEHQLLINYLTAVTLNPIQAGEYSNSSIFFVVRFYILSNCFYTF